MSENSLQSHFSSSEFLNSTAMPKASTAIADHNLVDIAKKVKDNTADKLKQLKHKFEAHNVAMVTEISEIKVNYKIISKNDFLYSICTVYVVYHFNQLKI